MAPDEVFGWKDVAVGGAVALSGLVAFTVHIFTKRLDKHEKSDDAKFSELVKLQTATVEKITTGFRELDHTINTIHVDLLKQINDRNRTP